MPKALGKDMFNTSRWDSVNATLTGNLRGGKFCFENADLETSKNKMIAILTKAGGSAINHITMIQDAFLPSQSDWVSHVWLCDHILIMPYR